MNSTNAARGAVLVLIALATARCLSCFDRLPTRMMTHFDIAGRPNGAMTRTDFFVVYGLLSGGTVLMLFLMQNLPVRLVNVPNREYWQAPEHRAELHAKLVGFFAWFAAWVGLLLAWVLELVLEANLQQRPLSVWQVQGTLSIALLGALMPIVWVVRAFRIPSTP